MGKLYDISQTLRPGIPVWPGDTAFEITETWSMGPDCPVRVSKVTQSTHAGTHADAPSHYDPGGATSEAVALDAYIGPCQVINVSAHTGAVSLSQIETRIKGHDGRMIAPRLLIRTYDRAPQDTWDSSFRAVEPALIDFIAQNGGCLIGTDTPSLDPQESKTMDAHKAVQRHGLAILEGLVLDRVPEGVYDLTALPIKIAGADAAPVRAILREI